MRLRTRVGLAGIAWLCAMCATGVPAAAAKKLKGTLSESGYTVIALNRDGSMTSADAGNGGFRLPTSAAKVTLHLRGPDGKYAGPIVVGGGGDRVIVGVRSGARLGDIAVREGFAEVERKIPKGSLDKSRTARARRGVPIGAGAYGRVRASTPRDAVPGDPDLDALPNPLDIDDDGDLVLDKLDRPKRPRAALRSTPDVDIECGYELDLGVGLAETRNANAPGLAGDAAEIDAVLASRGGLVIGCGVQESATGKPVPGGSWELDCGEPQSGADPSLGGLVYCTTGGTGRVPPPPPGPGPPRDTWPRFPDDFDPDGDGLGTLSAATDVLSHGAGSMQIGSGDIMIGRFTKG